MLMKAPSIVAVLLAASVGVSSTAGQHQRADAEALWSQAVAAKGGRAKLETVRNLVVTWTAKPARPARPEVSSRARIIGQRLYVFPGRFWEFTDARPSILGVSQRIYDLERADGWGPVASPIRGQGFDDGFRYHMLEGQLLYLLETAFMKPVPTGARSDTLDRAAVDVVEVTVPPTMPFGYPSEVRAEYYLDRETHLPLRLVLHYTVRHDPASRLPPRDYAIEVRYRIGQYIDVDGLQMPTVAVLEGPDYTTSYRINVDYDERAFTEPPPNIRQHPELAVPDRWEKK